MLVLNGYFDESGTHDGSDAVAVAGYLSTAEQWDAFDGDWSAALGQWGVRHFHMTDFANGAKPFDTWSAEERHTRFAVLTQIIHAHVIASVGWVIPTRLYDAIVSDTAKRYTGGPYGLAAVGCFIDAAHLLRPTFPASRIAYVFEHGARGAGQVLKVFQQNMADPAQRTELMMQSLKFEGKEFVPLQAADILAYELHKHLPRQTGLDQRPQRTRHLTMLARVKHIWGHLDEGELRKWSGVLELATKHQTFG